MKRYNEMTPEELVALTDEQIRRLIEIEVAFAAIKPVEIPIEPTLEAAGITAGVIGYKIGESVFLDEKDALAVQALPVLKEAYAYNISYSHRWLEPAEHKVEKIAFYRQEDVLRIGAALKENEQRRTAYKDQKRQYEAFLEKTTDISNKIWGAVREAKEALDKIEAAKRAYRKYLELADGDHEIAVKFFRDAFKDEEELIKATLVTEYVENVQIALQLNDSNPEQKGDADGSPKEG